MKNPAASITRITRLRRWREATAALIAAVGIAAAVATSGGTPAASAEAVAPVGYAALGGCNEYTVGNTGFEIGVCINDRGTGTTAYPDIYLNQIGAHRGSCAIRIELWDDAGHSVGNASSAPCTSAHHTGNAYGPVHSPVSVHAFARLQTNGTSYYFGAGRGDSPTIHLGTSSNGGTGGTSFRSPGVIGFDVALVTKPSALNSLPLGLRHCRAEIAPATLWKTPAFGIPYPLALRLGMNQCLRDHIAVGVILGAPLVSMISQYLPSGPIPTVINFVADYINSLNGQVGSWASDCGKYGYLFVQWKPARGAWLSCDAGSWTTV